MSLDGGPTTRQTCGEDTLNIRTNYRENLGDTGLQHDNAMDNISHHMYGYKFSCCRVTNDAILSALPKLRMFFASSDHTPNRI